MGAEHLASMLDRAKILFRAPYDLADIGDQAVAIGAVGAMKLLNEVEVAQLLAVEHDVVATAHLGDAVYRKTGGLVKAHTQVQHDHWHDHAVDDGSGDQVLRPVRHQPTEKAGFELAMRLADGGLELDPLALDLVQGAGLLRLHLAPQIVFKRAHLVE